MRASPREGQESRTGERQRSDQYGRRQRVSIVNAETTMPRLRHHAGELRLIDMDERGVVASFHIHLRLASNAVVDDHVQSIAFADWRHRAMGAILEQMIDLGFGREIDIVADLPP